MSSNLSAQSFSNPWTFYSTVMPSLATSQQSPFAQIAQQGGLFQTLPQNAHQAAQIANAAAPTAYSQYMANAQANPIPLTQLGVANNSSVSPQTTQATPAQSVASYTLPTVASTPNGYPAPAAPVSAPAASNTSQQTASVPLSQQQMLTAMGWLPSVASNTPGGPINQSQMIYMVDPNTGAVINTQTGQTYTQGNLSGAEAPPNLTAQGMAGWTGDQRFLPISSADAGTSNSGGRS